MADGNERSGAQLAANTARLGKAVANIAKGAAEGGLHGAALTAAKEFAPELLRAAVWIIVALIALPMVVFTAIPNIFFGFSGAMDKLVAEMTEQANVIGSAYYGLANYETTATDAIVTELTDYYAKQGKEVKKIVVRNPISDDDFLWFIAISSVKYQQDLDQMTPENVRQLYSSRLLYTEKLRGTTLRVTFAKIEPKKWMKQLGFDEESKDWATAIYETLAESNALEEYRDYFTGDGTDYGGDTGYTGGYEHGESYDTEIDISGFSNPETKNAHDLAAYALQAWENNWGYVWGTFGGILTPALFAYKLIQYPKGVGDHADYIAEHYLNRRTTDCVGLVKGYCWLDTESLSIQYLTNGMPDCDADSLHTTATYFCDHGAISTIPEIPGLGLWKSGHVGIYIGGGYAIEAMGTEYGVVKTAVEGRGWKEWFEVPYISYDSEIDDNGG